MYDVVAHKHGKGRGGNGLLRLDGRRVMLLLLYHEDINPQFRSKKRGDGWVDGWTVAEEVAACQTNTG